MIKLTPVLRYAVPKIHYTRFTVTSP